MTEDNLMFPGDFIGTSEEFMPGEGTYDENGNIYASTIGILTNNTEERTVGIIPKTSVPSVVKTGDIIIGRVTEVKESVVVVSIAYIKGNENRSLANTEQGVIHISNVKNAYISNLRYEFSYRDIVKAQVIDPKSMRLSTVENGLGVLKSICSRCKTTMNKKEGGNDNTLECPKCKRVETRNVSETYGSGVA